MVLSVSMSSIIRFFVFPDREEKMARHLIFQLVKLSKSMGDVMGNSLKKQTWERRS